MLVGLLKRATDRLEIAVLVYRVGQKSGPQSRDHTSVKS